MNNQVINGQRPDPQVEYLGRVVGQIAALPLWWALATALLLSVAIAIFALCLIVTVIMVKIRDQAGAWLVSHAPPGPPPVIVVGESS